MNSSILSRQQNAEAVEDRLIDDGFEAGLNEADVGCRDGDAWLGDAMTCLMATDPAISAHDFVFC